MQKRFTFMITILFLLMFVVACSNQQNTDQSSNTQERKQKPKIRKVLINHFSSTSLKEAMDVIQNTYQEEHPEVTLKFNFGGSGSLQQQISQGAPVISFSSCRR